MGDGSVFATGNNRLSAVTDSREEIFMLEWRPRLIMVVLALVLLAYLAGFEVSDLIVDNWEW
jgi:hypothetical protein